MNRFILQLSIIFIAVFSSNIQAQEAKKFFPEKDLMTVGIYYYPEHWDSTQWERDIKHIAEMGFEFVHMAEFAWFIMEPEEGQFNFDWLDKAISLCKKYDLKVLLCTPSATTPAWMRYDYPETFVMNGNYIRKEHGTRGLGSIVNSTYRNFVERIVNKMAERYGQDPSVVGWQLDNEPDAKADFSPSSQEAFRLWLKNKYQSIYALNMAWGNAFWSQWYNSFDQIIIPNTSLVGWWGNNPSAILDFKRYSADAQAEFLDFQGATLRNHISEKQYITTNYTAVCQGADPTRTKMLDFATFTAYPNAGQHNIGSQGFRLGNSRLISFANDYYRNITGVTGILELQPGSVNWGNVNPMLLPGTVKMWLWHNFAAGSSLACSYRFRQINYSTEQYHAAIVKTDGVTPSQGGKDYVQFMAELKKLREANTASAEIPKKIASRKTALLWNHENFWSMSRQKQTWQWDAWNFPGKYQEILNSFGAPVDIVSETADLESYNFVIIPAYELADSALINKWTNYVQEGGHLLVTCRTATKNRDGHFWEAETAAPISNLIGSVITNTDMLPGDVQGHITMDNKTYNWNNWADLLQPKPETEVLAKYSNQFYAETPAVVQHKIGKGSVIYVGVDTDDSELEKDILQKMYLDAGVKIENYPEGIYVYWRNGFYIAVNYSSDDYTIEIPDNAKIFVGEKIIGPTGVLVWTE